ncbi:MAG: type I secretion system permease/ATPase [Methylibium sp.]|nr:type I secretion system permease/ATPase [Methylibium sp.]
MRPMLAGMAAFSFVINLLFLVPAIFMLQVFDRVIPSNSQDTLVVLLVGTVGALLILLVLDYVRNRLQNVLGGLVDERLSPPVVQAIVVQSARRPHAAQAEGLRDISALRAVFMTNGLIALFDAPWVVFYVMVIWAFHPLLGIGAAVAAVCMLMLAWLNDLLSRGPLEALQKDSRRASQYLDSSLRNAEVLQALGMTQRLLARWQHAQDRLAALQTAAGRSTVAFAAGTRFMRQAIQILMLGLGAWLVLTGRASPGVMIATTILLSRAVQPIEQLVSTWRTLTEGRAAYRRLAELSKQFEPEAPHVTLPCPEGRLVVDMASYRVAGTDQVVLFNVAVSLEAGEAVAVVGPSAAGKSTLARLITGVWRPTSGSVRLDGADVATWPREDLGPLIGYVPQDVELFDGTVADNIARLGEIDSEAVIAAARRANVHDMILTLPQAYETQVGEQGLRLSPGQRQRIALARALYGNPRLVVLDEPNSNLDGAGEIALAHALGALRREGVTSVVVTHRPSLIAHVDKILVLEAGRVKRFGPAGEVMKTMQREAQVAVAEQAA